MSQQQTVLRVETNLIDFTYEVIIPLPPYTEERIQYKYTTLDLYGDIPIKINKSIAEIQDISKRNSDLSIGLTLPGSKKNNRFFEMFYNVDTQSLYFDPTKRVSCKVLLNDESYFSGYLRLNKISVLESKVEYDVTLYSTVGNLFGEIGNNLLQDLNFDDTEYTFNHTFSLSGVTNLFGNSNFYKNSEYPYTYFYPIVHNGYEYSGSTINFTGVTSGQTRLYTSTSPIGSWDNYSGVTAAGVQEYRINSPIYGLRDNQLKPGLNVWSLIQLMFKTYGYKIKSDFMNTPWMKSLYLYGYFSYEGTKFGWKVNNIQTLPADGVAVYFDFDACYVVKLGTGIPCYCSEDISVSIPFISPGYFVEEGVIKAGTSGYTYTYSTNPEYNFCTANNGEIPLSKTLSYLPKNVGDSAQYEEGDAVTFDLVIDQNIKQIDLLSSISKKFNLVFIADPDVPNQIIVEPYDYYIGSGTIYDWTPKLSWDKGFTVEPAQNFIESSLLLTDLEDGDEGNREFKNRVNRIYGQNVVYNPTDFKSQDKKIDTIFSPELIRKWDDNIGLPLGINYAATSEIDKVDNQVRWQYKGVKTKPKLFYWVGTANPFIDDVNEVYSISGTNFNTFTVKVAPSNITIATQSFERIPVVSHTMPLGLSDSEKINNDSLSILFNSELPVDIGVQTYNTYTENDTYNTFYRTRINNIYNPNTRVVSGYFDLKYSDVQNFQWKDVIKINEQYFTINKISEFNLTNRELTKVELIQLNVNPQQYVDRYFRYSYCDSGNCFKLKTDFTNPNLQDTNFIWSTYYDQQVGSLTGTTTGFTSTFRIFNTGLTQVQYVPYTMEEITESEYNSYCCRDSECDSLLNYIYNNPNGLNFSLASFWENIAGTYKGTNLWADCDDFYSTNTTYGIRTGSSITYGEVTGSTCQSCIDVGTGFNERVADIELQNDCKIIVAGGSTITYDGTPLLGISRLYPSGVIDTTFNLSPNFTGGTSLFDIIKIQPDGKILTIGSTSSLDLAKIWRLNTDGSIDTTFNSPTLSSDFLSCIEIQNDGKIIIGGGFTGSTQNRIIRLNSDGSKDTSFNIGTGFNTLYVYDIVIQTDGKIIVVGDFTAFNGTSVGGVCRLNSDGTLDTTFNSGGSGFNNSGNTVILQPDGKIIIGGRFSSYNGTSTSNNLIRLNTNGSKDSSFTNGSFTGGFLGFGNIFSLALQPDGKILAGGYFEQVSGVTTNHIVRLNSDGTRDTSFVIGTGFGSDASYTSVDDIKVLNDGNILAGGYFQSYSGNTANYFIKLTSTGGFNNCNPALVPTVTPTPTPTSTPTPTPTATPTVTPTSTPCPTYYELAECSPGTGYAFTTIVPDLGVNQRFVLPSPLTYYLYTGANSVQCSVPAGYNGSIQKTTFTGCP